jgi:MraZ protein
LSGFLGRFEYQLDAKGRVALPAPFRREAGDGRFVLLQWEPTHLSLYPESTWREVQERLVDFRRGDRAGQQFVRKILSNAIEVTPDKQGRILIPAWLQAGAALDGSVLLVGQLNQVEIWSPERFAAATEGGDADLGDLSQRIFL